MSNQKPTSIDEYIAKQETDKQAALQKMKDILKSVLPECTEHISWGMPTFRYQHNICHFAASKHHIGFYPGSDAIIHFANELNDYETSKGTIRIPYDRIDIKLIQKIALWCINQETQVK